MTNDKIPHTMPPAPKPSEPIPYFVSDRLDELHESLDDEQVLQLFYALKSMSYSKWMDWFDHNRAEISEFDELTATQRKQRLLETSDDTVLLLLHACVYLECLRVRVDYHYMQLRHDQSLSERQPHDYRMIIHASVCAFDKFLALDTWTFAHPDIHEHPLSSNDE